MSKKIVKLLVLLLVFAGSVVGFSLLYDTDNIDLTSEMADASLPVIYLKNQDRNINPLYGYRGEMNPLTMRDTITPLAEDLKLPVAIKTYQYPVEAISYTVRTLDLDRLMEETQVSDYTQKDGTIRTELQIQNLLETDQEYLLTITLEGGKETVSYYTRVIRPSEQNVDLSLDFVLDFHEKTFDKEKATELATYLEPNQEGDNTTLQNVTIHSNLNQVTWGDFKADRLEKPIPSVKEINSSFHTIVLNYVLAATGDGGELEYYNVEEYFRVRYSESNQRMSLLDYERSMNQIFRGSGKDLSENGLLLGIRNPEVNYMANDIGTSVCFVQEGELWEYDSNGNQLSLIFSFRGAEGMNERENNPDHDIRIIKVDEEGSVDFVVYGYMNRGTHEGQTGVGVYHYDGVSNTLEEGVFVSSDKAYQILKEDWGKLFYVNVEGSFYMIGEDALYRMDLKKGEEKKAMTGLKRGNFAVSRDGRYVAHRDNKKENLVTITDLEDETQREVTAESGEALCPIGFVESDFVYGTAKVTDIEEDVFPMYKITIVDKAQKVIKEYKKEGYYVSNAYVEDEAVYLDRVRKEGESYVPVEGEALKSREAEAAQSIRTEVRTDAVRQRQIALVSEQPFSEKAPQVLTPKVIVGKKPFVADLETQYEGSRYYVYAGGRVILCTEDVVEAIQSADSNADVVIGEKQNYIWRRGRLSNSTIADKAVLEEAELAATVDVTARCLTAMLRTEGISLDVEGLIAGGESPKKILKEAMPEATVLDLTGCTLNQALYYVSCKTPVFTLGENGEPLLIVGYDEFNTILYNPETNTTFKKGKQDSEAFFSNGGNVFLTYLKEVY